MLARYRAYRPATRRGALRDMPSSVRVPRRRASVRAGYARSLSPGDATHRSFTVTISTEVAEAVGSR